MSTVEHVSVFDHQQIFRESDLPVRSRLYCLDPQAMGSLWQESLTSYLNRLGWTHHVSPRAMVTQEVIPRLDKAQKVSRQWIGALSRGYAMNVNGVGSLALEWSTVLNQLTQRSDLHLLTLHGWIGNLSSVGHLRPALSWCPICYMEWQEQKVCIYQPLLWLFKVVTICPRHHHLLESHCPHCQKQQSVIALRTRPGHCTQCDQWLGRSPDLAMASQVTDELILWQQWILRALEELHLASRASGVLQWDPFFIHLAEGILSAVDLVAWKQVERLTGVKRHVINQWLQKKKIPSLETILQLCYLCEVTPWQVMQGEISPLVFALQREISVRPPVSRRTKPRADRDRCLELIHAVLDGREEPLGIRQLCERLGYSHRVLRYSFPEEYTLITQQAREYRKQQERQRVAKTREQVRQATCSLHVQGIYPSQRKVQSLLPAGVMIQAEARETWHVTLRELGLEPRHPHKT